MDKQVTSTPQYLEMGGSGYLCLHYWPPVDWEPAINVDMAIRRDESTGNHLRKTENRVYTKMKNVNWFDNNKNWWKEIKEMQELSSVFFLKS